MDYQIPLHRLVRHRSRKSYRLDVLLFVVLTLLLLLSFALSTGP
jgi:hypothetical protein